MNIINKTMDNPSLKHCFHFMLFPLSNNGMLSKRRQHEKKENMKENNNAL